MQLQKMFAGKSMTSILINSIVNCNLQF